MNHLSDLNFRSTNFNKTPKSTNPRVKIFDWTEKWLKGEF